MRAAPGSVSLAESLSACSIVVSYCVVLRAAELLLESSPQSLQPLLPSPANLPFQGAGGGCQLSYVCSRGAEWASIMRVCCGVLLLLRSRVALLAGLVQSGDSAELRRCGLIPLPYQGPAMPARQAPRPLMCFALGRGPAFYWHKSKIWRCGPLRWLLRSLRGAMTSVCSHL